MKQLLHKQIKLKAADRYVFRLKWRLVNSLAKENLRWNLRREMNSCLDFISHHNGLSNSFVKLSKIKVNFDRNTFSICRVSRALSKAAIHNTSFKKLGTGITYMNLEPDLKTLEPVLTWTWQDHFWLDVHYPPSENLTWIQTILFFQTKFPAF